MSERVVIDSGNVFATRDHYGVADAFTDDAEWVAPRLNATAVALNTLSRMNKEDIVRFISSEFGKLFREDIHWNCAIYMPMDRL